MAAFNAYLPKAWSHGNPVDLLGTAGAADYAKAVEIVSKEDGTDGVLVILTPQSMSEPANVATAVAKAVEDSRKVRHFL